VMMIGDSSESVSWGIISLGCVLMILSAMEAYWTITLFLRG
jgi:hypothetical protein